MTAQSMAALRRDRIVVGLGVVVITALGWAWMVHLAAGMDEHAHHAMGAMGAPAAVGWDGGALVLAVLMWAVMMVAMMLPSAGPMILTFTRVHHQRRVAGGAAVATAVFVAGYLAVWGAFSVLAALAQMALLQAALLASPMGNVGAVAGGLLLIGVGAFQWSPLKAMCLEKCRTPLGFLLAEWREGRCGAFLMGVRHGAFCTGCCWALMLLMFVGGVMNLAWMAALAVYMLAEKVLPHGQRLGKVVGAVLAVTGVWMVGGTALA